MTLLPETITPSTLAPGTVTATGTTGRVAQTEQAFKKLNHLGVFVVADCGADGTGASASDTELTDAVNLLAGKKGTIWIDGQILVGANFAFPDNVTLGFGTDGVLIPDNAVTITYNQATLLCGERQVFDLSLGGHVVGTKVGSWYSRWFGAKGDDSHDDGQAMQDCADTASLSGRNCNIVIGAGRFRHSQTLTYGSANHGMTLIGVPEAALRQGSANQACTLVWEGGAAPQILVGGYTHIVGMDGENHGTATRFIETAASGERAHLERISTLIPSNGATAWSAESIYLSNHNYATIMHWEAECAPGLRIGPAGSSLLIGGKTVIDCPVSNDPGNFDVPFIVFDDSATPTVITFDGVTFNGEWTGDASGGCGVLLDNTNMTGTLGILNFIGCDLTTNVSSPNTSPAVVKGRNIASINVIGTKIHHFSQIVDSPFLLRNCRIYFEGVQGSSNSHALVRGVDQVGEQSYVYRGPNINLDPTNTRGVHVDATSTAIAGSFHPIAINVSNVAKVHLERMLAAGSIGRIVIPNAQPAFTISIAVFSDSSDQGFLELGTVFELEILNTSGGNWTPTFTSQFQFLSDVSPRAIPNTKTLTLRFRWDGTKAVEVSRREPFAETKVAYNPPSIVGPGAYVTTNVTVPGAELGDFALASFDNWAGLPGDWQISAVVTAADTVQVLIRNNVNLTLDLPAGNVRARVLKRST